MPLGYEVKFNEFITAEAGLGITTNNSLDELLYAYDDFYALADKNLINLSHYASLKIFPEGNAFNDGYYLGFNYNFRPYSKGFNVNQSTVRATKRFTDIGLVFGFQGRPSEQILLDVYAGISQRHINWDQPSVSQIIDPLTGDVVTQIYIDNVKYPTLGGLLGFKLSYLFGDSIIKGASNTKKLRRARAKSAEAVDAAVAVAKHWALCTARTLSYLERPCTRNKKAQHLPGFLFFCPATLR